MLAESALSEVSSPRLVLLGLVAVVTLSSGYNDEAEGEVAPSNAAVAGEESRGAINSELAAGCHLEPGKSTDSGTLVRFESWRTTFVALALSLSGYRTGVGVSKRIFSGGKVRIIGGGWGGG